MGLDHHLQVPARAPGDRLMFQKDVLLDGRALGKPG